MVYEVALSPWVGLSASALVSSAISSFLPCLIWIGGSKYPCSHTQHSQERLWIHHHPDQDKALQLFNFIYIYINM